MAWNLTSHTFSSRVNGQGNHHWGGTRSSREDEPVLRNVPPVHER